MIGGLPVVRDAFARVARLVTTARLRKSVLQALVEKDELEALAEIEGATSQRLIAEARGTAGVASNELIYGVPHATFINAAFANSKPLELNRFNGPDRAAWYAALAIETSIEEVKFHMTEFLAQAGDFNATVEYAELFASFAGEFVDLRSSPDHPALNSDKSIGYRAGNALANLVRSAGVNGVIYPSVRHEGGTCIVALFPHVVQSVAQGDVWRLVWSGGQEPSLNKA
jgi:hypothetical protein